MVSVFTSFFKKIAHDYRKMSIQRIISFSFTAVSVAGMVLVGLAMFLRFSHSTDTIMLENGQRTISQVNMSLDNHLRRMMHVSDTIYYRSIKSADFSADSIHDSLALLYEANRDAVVSVAVFDKTGGLVSATPLMALKPSVEPAAQEWFASAMGRVEDYHFSTPHVQNLFDDPDYAYQWVVSMSRQVNLEWGGVTKQGVLLVDMSFDGIEQICRNVELSSGWYLYLMDSNGEIIYHPQQQQIYAGLAQENNLAAAKHSDGVFEEDFNGTKRQVIVKTVGYTGWKLVGVVSSVNLKESAQQLLVFGILLLLFFVFLIAFLNSRISQHISDPIRRLEKSVKALESSRADIEVIEDGCYEVQRLSRSIRSMVSMLHHLMDDIIEQEEQKRRSELEVLQSQINPHFLYNTLDSVVWMVEGGRYEEAISMVTSLARLFRISLSKGKSIIPLADELEHARHYMTIQEIRYKNRFRTHIVMDDDVKGAYCLKLIVQPLLENAIYHGLPAGVDDGQITVHAYRDGEDVVIDVADNGVGMPPEVAGRLLNDNTSTVSTKGSGIGVRNVHQRIRLTFGEPYGLTVISEPDEGTTVRIRLPALTEPEALPNRKEGLV